MNSGARAQTEDKERERQTRDEQVSKGKDSSERKRQTRDEQVSLFL
jgi:hypothetical protein